MEKADPGLGLRFMQVTVAYSPHPQSVQEWAVTLPVGTTVDDAVLAAGVLTEFPGLSAALPVLGIWGTVVLGHEKVQAGDRVEIYRPLRVDPKVARRERFGRQGSKGAGLFAKSRPGGKQGY